MKNKGISLKQGKQGKNQHTKKYINLKIMYNM